MKLSNLKTALQSAAKLSFQLPDSTSIPAHFHVTEVGIIIKNFIDCGGTQRTEQKINFQLWYATDTDHRLTPEKLLKIIAIAENKWSIGDLEIEVEYQNETTIGKYGIDFNGENFILSGTKTACLAEENCGIPAQNKK